MSNEDTALVGEEGPMIWRVRKKTEEKQQDEEKQLRGIIMIKVLSPLSTGKIRTFLSNENYIRRENKVIRNCLKVHRIVRNQE